MIFALFLLPVLAAEDVPETAYDESEAPPYEGVPPLSIVVPPVNCQSTQDLASSIIVEPGAPSTLALARVHDRDANRSTDARVCLALLCTLLC